jgi:hypothetical protein
VVTSNTDNDELGVFTANKRVPSAESRIGLVCEASKLAYAGEAAASGVTRIANARNITPTRVSFVSDIIISPTLAVLAVQVKAASPATGDFVYQF